MDKRTRNKKIYQEYIAGGVTQKQLAEKYGRSIQTIQSALFFERRYAEAEKNREPFLGLSGRGKAALRKFGVSTEDEARSLVTWDGLMALPNVGARAATEVMDYLGLPVRKRVETKRKPTQIEEALRKRAEVADARVAELDAVVVEAERRIEEMQAQIAEMHSIESAFLSKMAP